MESRKDGNEQAGTMSSAPETGLKQTPSDGATQPGGAESTEQVVSSPEDKPRQSIEGNDSIEEHVQPAKHDDEEHQDDMSSIGRASSFSVALSVDTDSDADSALGLDLSRQSSSVSVSSSVYHFVEEFGRTFHRYKEGKYFLPNDEQEQNRLDLQHAIALRILNGKLYLAPIEKPNRVLDIGTGTGIWAIEFAEQHPEADVLGTDLSPIQPEYVPPNCRFEIDDAEDEWVFNHTFDYIHGRYMCPFISDPPKLFERIYDNLIPGGWVEFQETLIDLKAIDNSLEGTALQRWNRLILEGIRKTGRDALSGAKYKSIMKEAGFQKIQERKFALPTSPWAKGRDEKILGAMQMTNNLEGVGGITLNLFTKVHGWSREAVELFLVDVRKDLGDKNIHSYFTIMTVWGQKPEKLPGPDL